MSWYRTKTWRVTSSSRKQHRPTELKLRKSARALSVTFADGKVFDLPLEYLRVYSPSAEVRGHGPGQEVLQVGKKHVTVTRIEPVGSYAIRLVFDDGHNSGLYSWDVLYDLGSNHAANWASYLQRLEDAGASREPLNTGHPGGNDPHGTH